MIRLVAGAPPFPLAGTGRGWGAHRGGSFDGNPTPPIRPSASLGTTFPTRGKADVKPFGATDVSRTILVDDGALVVPGDQAEIMFVLGKPVGVENGMRFAIREGGKTVGAGLVTEVAA